MRITSSLLVKWTLGSVTLIYLSFTGMAYLFATVGQMKLTDVYPITLTSVAVMLFACVTGFYKGLRKYVVNEVQSVTRRRVAPALQRTMVLSMIASIQLVCVILGVAALRKEIFAVAYTFLILAIGFTVLQFIALRHSRQQGSSSSSEQRDSFRNLLIFSFLLAFAACFFIVAVLMLQSKDYRLATLFFAIGLALGAIGLAAAVKHVRAQEAWLPPERRVFRTAMTVFWLSVLVVTLFFGGFVLLFGPHKTAYAVPAFLTGGFSLWVFLKECRKAEAKFDQVEQTRS